MFKSKTKIAVLICTGHMGSDPWGNMEIIK